MSADKTLYQPPPALNLLDLPLLCRLLRWRWGRLVMQSVLLLIALLLIIDGFIGPQTASRNLATVAPWVHYRGLVVIALLLAGNLFCMSCPFTLTRTLAKRLSISGRRFPRLLRNKWVAIAGLFTIFFLYEWLDLWASPLLTAWVIVAYFLASFVLEAIFTESPFCKYVCPLGSFNFVYATAAPTQIGVKDREICRTCVGKECLNGSYSPQPLVRLDAIPGGEQREVHHGPDGTLGCGTQLFAPQISSNLDCTLCLDCARACPHDNVGWLARMPGRELLQAGAWPARWDVSMLAIMLTFMAITNAFGMVPPVYALQAWLVETFSLTSDFPVLMIIFVTGNLLLPVIITLPVAQLTRWLTGTVRSVSLRDTVATFAPAFVPVGFGIWIAHYGFHFLIAPLSIVPVLQEFMGQPGQWARYSMAADAGWIGLIQVSALVGGFVWSMIVVQRVSLLRYQRLGFMAMLPWALYLLVLMLIAFQIMAMPMEMRGTEFLFD